MAVMIRSFARAWRHARCPPCLIVNSCVVALPIEFRNPAGVPAVIHVAQGIESLRLLASLPTVTISRLWFGVEQRA